MFKFLKMYFTYYAFIPSYTLSMIIQQILKASWSQYDKSSPYQTS